MLNKVICSLCFLFFVHLTAQSQNYQIALVKYNGGGDWYANYETSLPNLIAFCNREFSMNIHEEQATVELAGNELYYYPFLHMTGHGNVVFSESEASNLRNYLENGGFLHIDDNYGMDQFVRTEMRKVFPELNWQEIPLQHSLFTTPFSFPEGTPKIHQHDDKRPQTLGLFYKDRLVCLYTYEADLGDGWENPEVHNDSEEKHLEALRFGANMLYFVFMQRN